MVPKYNTEKILIAYHGTPFGGHQGTDRTIDVIKEQYYWKNMNHDIEPKTHAGNHYILTFQDHFSKFPEAFRLPDQRATTIARISVKEVVWRHRTPEKLQVK